KIFLLAHLSLRDPRERVRQISIWQQEGSLKRRSRFVLPIELGQQQSARVVERPRIGRTTRIERESRGREPLFETPALLVCPLMTGAGTGVVRDRQFDG